MARTALKSPERIVIDATGKKLGRLGTEIALALRGKTMARFQPHILPTHEVVVKNTDEIVLTGRKFDDKKYWHFTGFPGGMRLIPFSKVFRQDSRLTVIRTVRGMLPKNRLRDKLIKNLRLFKGEVKA